MPASPDKAVILGVNTKYCTNYSQKESDKKINLRAGCAQFGGNIYTQDSGRE